MYINCMDINILYLGILYGVFMFIILLMMLKFDVCDVSLIGILNFEVFFFSILLIKVNSKVWIFF